MSPSATISNGVSLIGRILPLFFAQRLGPINVIMAAAGLSGMMQLMWTLARSTAGVLVYDGMYGIVSGAYGATISPGSSSFAPHTNQSGLHRHVLLRRVLVLACGHAYRCTADRPVRIPPCQHVHGAVLLIAAGLFLVSHKIRAKQLGSQWV
jgi:hypothetical protein